MSWCTNWKGTPQDCIGHLQQKHLVPSSVKPANLGRWFQPWMVTREMWCQALKQQVGVSTDVLLFSESARTLVHHYRVFGRGVAHTSLRWKFLAKLQAFIVRNIRPHYPVDDSPQCKSHRAVFRIISEVSSSAMPSTVVTSITLSSGAAPSAISPTSHSLLYGGRPPLLPVSLQLSRFANKDCVSSSIQSDLAATRVVFHLRGRMLPRPVSIWMCLLLRGLGRAADVVWCC